MKIQDVNKLSKKITVLDKEVYLVIKDTVPVSNSMLSHAGKLKNSVELNYFSTASAVTFDRKSFNLMTKIYRHDADSAYYSKLRFSIKSLIDDFNNYILNDRQLIYSNPVDCISLIHIIPTLYVDKLNESRELLLYDVFIYQRSAYVTKLVEDISFIYEEFITSKLSNITYVVNNIHYLEGVENDTI